MTRSAEHRHDDDDLEALRSDRSLRELARLDRLDRAEPARALDRAVLEAAGVRTVPRTRWLLPAALAAALPLVFALAALASHRGPQRQTPAARTLPDSSAVADSSTVADRSAAQSRSSTPSFVDTLETALPLAAEPRGTSATLVLRPVVGAHPSSPAEWLRQIAQLRSQGRLVEAERERSAFRLAYPSYGEHGPPERAASR